MRRICTILFGVLAFAFATLLAAEALLRVREYVFDDPRAVAARAEMNAVVARIHRLWFRGDDVARDPFIPPFAVFSNAGFDDPERLAFIAKESELPPSREWTSYDFLQDETKAARTTYSVRSNALGFRGPEYSAEKPEGATRIIVLGSYQAFGLGVEDEETYPANLEAQLNASSSGERYEVWNGGRPAGTAIVGLARLDEVLSYEPDLLIIDYGFVDTLVYGDNVFPLAMRFPDSGLARAARAIARPMLYLFDHSRLSDRLYRFFALGKVHAERLGLFSSVIERMIERAHAAGVPVILVSHIGTLPPPVYEALERPGVLYVNVDDVFAQASSTLPHPDEWTQGYYADTWLGELDAEVVGYAQQQFRFAELRLNVYQLNSRGQETLAAALVPAVRMLLGAPL